MSESITKAPARRPGRPDGRPSGTTRRPVPNDVLREALVRAGFEPSRMERPQQREKTSTSRS